MSRKQLSKEHERGANSRWKTTIKIENTEKKQEKLKAQIEENESVLEMLRIYGNDSSIIRVFSRLESLKRNL